MEGRMEITEGLGREAEVWVDGNLLTVCDGISPSGTLCPPGVLEDVRFSYMTEAGFSWDAAARGNPSRKKLLEPVRRWAYAGFGRVLQVMPVVSDFGVLTMEDANWTTDESLVGRYVRIPLDRLELTRAHEAAWPEDLR